MEQTQRSFAPGDFLMHQNELSRYMYIIKSGKVKIYRQDGGMITYTTLVGPGGLVGELSLIDGLPRSANAVALEKVEASVITSKQVDDIHKNVPNWLSALARSLAMRIRAVISKLERSPTSYLERSVVSLLIYYIISEGDKMSFEKKYILGKFADILRLSETVIEDVLAKIDNKILKIEGEHLKIIDFKLLEEHHEVLKMSITKDHLEAFKP